MRTKFYQNRLAFVEDMTKTFGVFLSVHSVVLVCNERSLVGLCTKDYKSLCAAVTICATLVNTQTHTRKHIF